MVSSFLTRDQALSLWSGSTASKTLDYQRTSSREYQIMKIVRTHTKKTTQHHPTTCCTLCKTPHLNNKQNKNTNIVTSRQDHHLSQPCPSEENKQINKNNRKIKSTNITLYEAYTNHWTKLRGKKQKGRKNSTLKLG